MMVESLLPREDMIGLSEDFKRAKITKSFQDLLLGTHQNSALVNRTQLRKDWINLLILLLLTY